MYVCVCVCKPRPSSHPRKKSWDKPGDAAMRVSQNYIFKNFLSAFQAIRENKYLYGMAVKPITCK